MNRRNAIALTAAAVAMTAVPAKAVDYAAMADMGRPAKRALGFLWYNDHGVYAQLWTGYDIVAPDKFACVYGASVPEGPEDFADFVMSIRHGSEVAMPNGAVVTPSLKGEPLFGDKGEAIRRMLAEAKWKGCKPSTDPIEYQIEFHASRIRAQHEETEAKYRDKPWYKPTDVESYLFA